MPIQLNSFARRDNLFRESLVFPSPGLRKFRRAEINILHDELII